MGKKRKKSRIGKYLFLLVLFSGIVFISFRFRNDVPRFWVDDTQYSDLIAAAAVRNNVDGRLIRAVIFQESAFRAHALGGAGEVGLMQLLPSAAVTDWAKEKRCEVPSRSQLFAPELNIEIGSWYLGKALRRWQGYDQVTELALCQYNAGESRANKWKPEELSGDMIDRIDIASTRDYVQKIMKKYAEYCENESK